ncbi:MAG: CaiB/BaiF CoA-transferase family protein [SAR324 cluster bacterium]|nr:CaiB/BaiF CoA-transferase family protein [SAR324 cluster bacterium]
MPDLLSGIKVLDLTRFQAGPACTLHLATYGADVIKAESPGKGDPGRTALALQGVPRNPYFLAMNHSKRSITADYHHPDGLELLLRLGASCDVVVENFRPGAADGLGLGYGHFKARNPKIVYASLSAFGEEGELAGAAGFDIHGQAMGGLMSTTGDDGNAYPVGAAIADQLAGLTLVSAILGALLARERQGFGQRVSVSLYGCQLSLQAWEIARYAMTGKLPGKGHNSHPTLRTLDTAWGSYATKDGYIVLDNMRGVQQQKLYRVLGLPDPGPGDPHVMPKLGEELEEIRRLLKERSTAEWLEAFHAEDVHVSKVNTYEDIVNDPQARANGYVEQVRDDAGNSYTILGPPIRFSETPARLRSMPPELGEHTEHVLGELGYSAEEIARLRESKAV